MKPKTAFRNEKRAGHIAQSLARQTRKHSFETSEATGKLGMGRGRSWQTC